MDEKLKIFYLPIISKCRSKGINVTCLVIKAEENPRNMDD